jgi:glutamate---cysteine ligase / carboxylate-amine ligase
MDIPFLTSPQPTLGVEVEIHLTDRETGALTSAAADLLAELDPDRCGGEARAKHELFLSTLEVVTGVCATPSEARSDLARTLAAVREVADGMGVRPLGAGTHPFSCADDQEVSPDPRYHALVEEMQWTARRLLICGTHFHVGVPSGEHAVAAVNELLRHLPLLLILSASSPYFEGEDTGMASVRSKVFESLPTAGLPPELADWADFEEFMETLVTSGVIRTVRDVWWDIRPHPDFGTVELRMCDASPTLREVTALAALAQCLVADVVQRFDAGELRSPPRPWTVKENRWLAARHGVNADLIATDDGQRRPAEVMLESLVERLEPIAAQLGSQEELADVLEIWSMGPSYLRQRQVVDDGGTLDDVACHLADELEAESAADAAEPRDGPVGQPA